MTGAVRDWYPRPRPPVRPPPAHPLGPPSADGSQIAPRSARRKIEYGDPWEVKRETADRRPGVSRGVNYFLRPEAAVRSNARSCDMTTYGRRRPSPAKCSRRPTSCAPWSPSVAKRLGASWRSSFGRRQRASRASRGSTCAGYRRASQASRRSSFGVLRKVAGIPREQLLQATERLAQPYSHDRLLQIVAQFSGPTPTNTSCARSEFCPERPVRGSGQFGDAARGLEAQMREAEAEGPQPAQPVSLGWWLASRP